MYDLHKHPLACVLKTLTVPLGSVLGPLCPAEVVLLLPPLRPQILQLNLQPKLQPKLPLHLLLQVLLQRRSTVQFVRFGARKSQHSYSVWQFLMLTCRLSIDNLP